MFTTPEAPSLADLTYRLRLVSLLLPAYVQFDGDIDVDMNTPDRLQAIADALEMPDLRGRIQSQSLADAEDPAVLQSLDELKAFVNDTAETAPPLTAPITVVGPPE